jgi:hypothetical protein
MKTAKEKAKELVDKYYHLFSVELENTIDLREAKQSALIAVDYIITSNPHGNFLNYEVRSTMGYWQEVKQEIEKM